MPSGGETAAYGFESTTYLKQVIRDCQGLAVFHILHAGLHSSSASGSGVVISRITPDRWSGVSGISVDYDLPEGIDVADIVVVVNDEHGLEALSRPSNILGKGLAIMPGPIPQSQATASRSPTTARTKDMVFFYVKSKGQLVELDLGHLIIREAKAENERFCGMPGVSAKEILSGQVETPSGASDHLYSTIKSLERRSASLSGLPKSGKCPGDHRVRVPVTVE